MQNRSLIALLALFSAPACNLDKLVPKGTPTVFTDEKNAVQLTVPAGWVKDDLNDQAKIQASRRLSEEYVMVISESKEDFGGMTIEKYSKITRDAMTASMTGVTEGALVPMTINGLPAVRCELRGTVDNLNVVYLHTIVEAPSAYHQIVAWTLKSKFEQNKDNLAKVSGTLVSTAPAAQLQQAAAAAEPPAQKQAPKSGAPLVLKDVGSGVQLTMPAGWVKSNDASLPGQIQGTRDDEVYVMVVSESKADFADMTLKKFAEITRESIVSSLTEVTLGPVTPTKIHGRAALRVEVRGVLDGLNLVYLHTATETPKAYHQIVAWTTKSKFEKNKDELINVSSALEAIK